VPLLLRVCPCAPSPIPLLPHPHILPHPPQDKYKLPDTEGEKQAKAAEACALKERGNVLFRQGERFEAAKLYEQAVRGLALALALALAQP
jgi:hypothetical protein